MIKLHLMILLVASLSSADAALQLYSFRDEWLAVVNSINLSTSPESSGLVSLGNTGVNSSLGFDWSSAGDVNYVGPTIELGEVAGTSSQAIYFYGPSLISQFSMNYFSFDAETASNDWQITFLMRKPYWAPVYPTVSFQITDGFMGWHPESGYDYIQGFIISNSASQTASGPLTVSNIQYSVAVPEPSSLPLFACAMLLALWRFPRKGRVL